MCNLLVVCELPKAVGNGYEQLDRYYYNYNTGSCEQFYYSGQGGNNNCFKDKTACQQQTQFCKQYHKPEPGIKFLHCIKNF